MNRAITKSHQKNINRYDALNSELELKARSYQNLLCNVSSFDYVASVVKLTEGSHFSLEGDEGERQCREAVAVEGYWPRLLANP